MECEPDQATGKNWFDTFIPERVKEQVKRIFAQLMAGENSLIEYVENEIIISSGNERIIRCHNSLIRDEAGKITGTLSSGEDITERKLLESQLVQGQKMEAIGTLSGGIAHDFNNILSAIIGYTELAMLEHDERRIQNNLKRILQASERATSLVSQILTFSRKSDVDKKPINIGYIVKEALKLLRAAIPTTIEIRIDIDSEYMIALANHTQIHQVMMNLCTNAAFAMIKRGGVMEIS